MNLFIIIKKNHFLIVIYRRSYKREKERYNMNDLNGNIINIFTMPIDKLIQELWEYARKINPENKTYNVEKFDRKGIVDALDQDGFLYEIQGVVIATDFSTDNIYVENYDLMYGKGSFSSVVEKLRQECDQSVK